MNIIVFMGGEREEEGIPGVAGDLSWIKKQSQEVGVGLVGLTGSCGV